MNATLERTTPVANTPRTPVSRETVEQLLGDAAYILQLTRRVRSDIVSDSVRKAREVRQAVQVG